MSCSSDAGAPRKLICVLGIASGVPGSGEIVTGATAVETAAIAGATPLTGPMTIPSSATAKVSAGRNAARATLPSMSRDPGTDV